MSEDNYITVEVQIVEVRERSIKITTEEHPNPVYLPRSVMHGADERLMDDVDCPTTMTVRILEWFVNKEELA